jgi:hypothetical protein
VNPTSLELNRGSPHRSHPRFTPIGSTPIAA